VSAKDYPPLKGEQLPPLKGEQLWSWIAALIAGGAINDKRDIAGARRNATSEIYDIFRLMRTPEVAFFLEFPPEGLDPVVEQFIAALDALQRTTNPPIVPAKVQHYIADLIDPPKRSAHRPKWKQTDMLREQRENQKLEQGRQDLAEMEALLARHGTEAAALAEFARAKVITVPAAKRRYRQAAKMVEAADSRDAEELQRLVREGRVEVIDGWIRYRY